MTTLDEIRLRAGSDTYPVRVLDGASSALIVFAAAFFGLNDAVFIADAGITATCVDSDRGRLETMREMYPDSWRFVTDDAYAFGESAMRSGETWDVVTVDPWTSAFDRCAVVDWPRLARRAVVLGVGPDTVVAPRNGWRETERLRRSEYRGGVYWAVIERAT